MKVLRTVLPLLFFAAAGTQAHAQLTREQVQAELAEAIRNGEMTFGESGLRLNELYPARYPNKQVPAAKTREQVKAELAEAIRTGDMVVGESGLKLNELHPQRYPARPAYAGKTREQVKAELAEAIRTGDMPAGGESGQMLYEAFPQRYAKIRASMDASRSPAAVAAAASAGASYTR